MASFSGNRQKSENDLKPGNFPHPLRFVWLKLNLYKETIIKVWYITITLSLLTPLFRNQEEKIQLGFSATVRANDIWPMNTKIKFHFFLLFEASARFFFLSYKNK